MRAKNRALFIYANYLTDASSTRLVDSSGTRLLVSGN